MVMRQILPRDCEGWDCSVGLGGLPGLAGEVVWPGCLGAG